jgi:hypothetical protein
MMITTIHRGKFFLCGWVAVMCFGFSAVAQSGNSAKAQPEHPITEKQMRTYFEVCRVTVVSRELTHEKADVQRKQLPPWYPQSVWDEIEAAIDGIDLPAVALPIYRKYLGEEDADRLIRFFRTKPGQQIIATFVEQEITAQHAGISPTESHKLALAYLLDDKNGGAHKIVGEMTPSQRVEAESLSRKYQQMQPTMAQIQKEYSQALVAKQTELVNSILAKRQPALANAKQKYDASQASGTRSNSTLPK